MKQMTILIMVIVFFGILIGANIYLANRYAFYFGVENVRWFYVLFAATTILMIGGVMGATNSVSMAGHVVFIAGAIIMGFVLYLLLSTVVVDLVSLLHKTKPINYGIAAISLAAIVSIYGIWNAKQLKITNVDITIQGLKKPVRAAHLTDTHLGHFRGANNLQHIVDEINAQHVDVVFFTGDLLDSKIQLNNQSMLPLKNLKAPIYFVEGNHDEYTGVDAINGFLRNIGVNVLENDIAYWGELQIIGLNFMVADSNASSPHAHPNGPNIRNVLRSMSIKKDMPTVFLHHGPDGIKYANEAGVDLYLAGHTHAGQLWPATLVAKMLFDYNRGLHRYKNTQIYVCQGTGTFGPPMRVGTQSELAIINLLPDKTK